MNRTDITKNHALKRILDNKALTAHFQQVVYLTCKRVCGLEGLIRAVDGGKAVPPGMLFEAAHEEGLVLELDRICRDKVLEAFAPVHKRYNDKMLFMNLDASILDEVCCSGYLIGQAEKYGIPPGNIVIEINETKVQNNSALKSFIEMYRKAGFLIALDDVGAGFSNLDRIPVVKPDIIKVDIGLVRGIHRDYHKQEVFKSLVRLSTQIGAVVVAEGVESEQEAMETLRLGANMIQGYYFSKPSLLPAEPFANPHIETLAGRFSQFILHKLREEKQTVKEMTRVVTNALSALKTADEPNKMLTQIVRRYDCVECMYILQENGIQCSETVFCSGKGSARSLMFNSAQAGADHSMKRYYYQLAHKRRDSYVSEPYVSLATGNLCVTYAKSFTGADNKSYILCMDFSGNALPNANISESLV